jgi:hypothetical protein
MNKQYIYIGSSFLEELYVPPAEPAKTASSEKASQKVARIRKAYGSNASTEQKATQLDRLFVVGPHNFMSHKIYEEGVDFERKEIGLKNFEGYGNRFNKVAIPIRKVLDAEKVYEEEEELEDDYEEDNWEDSQMKVYTYNNEFKIEMPEFRGFDGVTAAPPKLEGNKMSIEGMGDALKAFMEADEGEFKKFLMEGLK